MGKTPEKRNTSPQQQEAPVKEESEKMYTDDVYIILNLRQFITICAIIAFVAFALGIGATLGVQALRNSDTSTVETTPPEMQYTFVPEETAKPTPSEEPSLSVNTTPPTTSSQQVNSDSSDAEPTVNINSDEYIMEHPDSSARFKTIDNKAKFHDKIQLMYFNGEWDGKPMVLDGHYISLSHTGHILADAHLLGSSDQTVDLPLNFDMYRIDSCNYEYISEHGTYFVEDETFFKCVKGEEIKLGTLSWMDAGEGVDKEYGHPIIHYDEVNDKMFLWSPMIFDPFSVPPLYDYTYLYILPDYDTAKMEFVAKVKINEIEFDEKGIKFTDTDGTVWRYSDKGGKNNFVNDLK